MSGSPVKGYYAIPKSIASLPAFAISDSISHAWSSEHGHHLQAHARGHDAPIDEGTMRKCVTQMSRELDICLDRLEESGRERELLVAERTHLIVQVQV